MLFICTAASALGCAYFVYHMYGFLSYMWALHVQAPVVLKSLGQWAVVTGATDGIGKAMSLELARRGMSLLLISRSAEKLAATEQEIRELQRAAKGAGVVKTLVIDFSEDAATIFPRIREAVESLDVGVLINNVGLSYPSAQYFDEITEDFIDSLIEVNVRSLLRLTNIIYPQMCKKGKGAIVCVGSGASILPSEPLYAGYSATKSVGEAFCRSLQVEAAERGIIVQCHTPLLVSTKLSKVKKSSITVPSAERYARSAIVALEHPMGGRSTVSPYIVHKLILGFICALPSFIWHKVRFAQTKTLRRKYMEKNKKSS